MHGLELNYCAWFVLSVSSLPLSVMVRSCHACVNSSRLRSSGFLLSRHCALVVALHWRNSELGISNARNYPRTFGLHEILYSIWPQTDIHTTSTNAVTLVWGCSGSPQLHRWSPIIRKIESVAGTRKWTKAGNLGNQLFHPQVLKPVGGGIFLELVRSHQK